MRTDEPLRLQLIWHFHQPYYGVPGDSHKAMPWVRLHATKSYHDMGRLLQQHPQIRCTVNASGALLEQLNEYTEQGARDTWWSLTRRPADQLTERERRHLLHHFFSVDWQTCVAPYPRYQELLTRRQETPDDALLDAFSVDDLRDLQVWFNLVWFGFTAREEREVVRVLVEKGSGFTEAEKEALLEQQGELLQIFAPLYQKLATGGQVELSVSPMYHPIMPLLIDTDVARACGLRGVLPPRCAAPEDAAWHVEAAQEVAFRTFGMTAAGMWPPEGAVSHETAALFAAQGVEWIAADESTLRASRGETWDRSRDLYQPWAVEGLGVFFRDRTLGEQITGAYCDMPAAEAVADLLDRLRAIDEAATERAPVVTIVVDGENPWEHFERDGAVFLNALYTALARADWVQLVTPVDTLDALSDRGEAPAPLERLAPGSWLCEDFSAWIGSPGTNRAWSALAEAREALTLAGTRRALGVDLMGAWRALYAAEGSDWFWWYGDNFLGAQDADFDRLFREQLRAVYQRLRLEVPARLTEPLLERAREPAFEPPTAFITPRIDGYAEYLFEWAGAGVFHNTGRQGAMFDQNQLISAIYLGHDRRWLYLRLDFGPDLEDRRLDATFEVAITTPAGTYTAHISTDGGGRGHLTAPDGTDSALERVAFGADIELALSFRSLQLDLGDTVTVHTTARHHQTTVEQHTFSAPLTATFP